MTEIRGVAPVDFPPDTSDSLMMPRGGGKLGPMTLAELQAALHQVDPSAFLAPARILRRVIRKDRKLIGLRPQVPHRKSYICSREALRSTVDLDELGLPDDCPLPAKILLLAEPSERLAAAPGDQQLLAYWRRLFHLYVHVHMDERFHAGRITEAILRERIHRIGQTEFDEIRSVLHSENFLLPPRDHQHTYTEFAAVYLELKFFAPTLLRRYFPGLADDASVVEEVLREDVDGQALFERSRPPGAGAPNEVCDPEDVVSHRAPVKHAAATSTPAASAGAAREPITRMAEAVSAKAERGLHLAEQFERRGNYVRAAIMCARVARKYSGESAVAARRDMRHNLEKIVRGVQRAIDMPNEQVQEWIDRLMPVVHQATSGLWNQEARLLADLQAAGADCQKEFWSVDVVEWALWFGQRPLRRPLPNVNIVRVSRHLHRATQRLPHLLIADVERKSVADSLEAAAQHTARQFRERFGPLVGGALDKVGIRPNNLPERVAREKLVDQLIDRIFERGFCNFSDVRDALSRNQLKLRDLGGPSEVFGRDELLKLDLELAFALDGVYRRSEAYLRWEQTGSALAFGTKLGRLFVKYVAVPFGGAYAALAGTSYLLEEIPHFGEYVNLATHHDVELVKQYTAPLRHAFPVVSLGAFFLALLYVPPFRSAVWYSLKKIGWLLWLVCVDAPLRFMQWDVVRRVVHSYAFFLIFCFLVQPLLSVAILLPVWRLVNFDPYATLMASLLVYLFSVLVLNSRIGRSLQEIGFDWIAYGWRQLWEGVLPGLIRFILDFFKAVLELVERLLYMGDEFFRFNSSESKLWGYVLPALGVLWFGVHYVVRFCVMLLIEPQVNPIKHFPVVTVSHKLLLPLIPVLAEQALMPFLHMGKEQALASAALILASVPGVFGFLAWELSENWKLYESNRPDGLAPVVIGAHGETLLRFLKPGFHSGQVPKLFARLRRAERKAVKTGDWLPARKVRGQLHHIVEEIEHFVDRELIRLLQNSRGWDGLPIAIAHVELTSNSIRLEFTCSEFGDRVLEIALEEQAGYLISGIAKHGWLDELTGERRRVFRLALAGFYKLCGVHMVREQVASCFPPGMPYDLSADGLVIWPDREYTTEILYSLETPGPIEPQVIAAPEDSDVPVLPALTRSRLLYSDLTLTWDEWVANWERDQRGAGIDPKVLFGMPILPGDKHNEMHDVK